MIPIVLITGFLGSGKTTLLRSLVEQTRGRRCVCIVNEFSAVDVDGQLIELPPGQLVSIPGGSIFCRCLAGEFIRVLHEVSGQAETPAPELVLIEASGIADPRVIVQMLEETRLDQTYVLSRVVSVVDPGSFLALIETLPNIIAQVEASDLVLINKVDLYDAERLARCEEQVRQINSSARLARTQHCHTEWDWLTETIPAEAAPRSLAGQYALCADPNYRKRTIAFEKPVDRDKLLTALRSLHPHIYRAKGFVPTTSGQVHVDVSAAGVNCKAAAEPQDHNNLAIIASPTAEAQVEAFMRAIGSDPPSDLLT